MEPLTRLAWFGLALIHLSPAAPWLAPRLVTRLYGVPSNGNTGVLLSHRGALFAGVMVSALVAAVDPGSRRLACVVTAISVIGFLGVYVRSGAASGPLRTIAWVDAAALLPLAFVTFRAFLTPG